MEPLEAACPCRSTSPALLHRGNASTSCVEPDFLARAAALAYLHNCTTMWCVRFQAIHRYDSLRMLGRSTGRGYGAGGVDRRICQTFAASPAEPGELPCWFRCGASPHRDLDRLEREVYAERSRARKVAQLLGPHSPRLVVIRHSLRQGEDEVRPCRLSRGSAAPAAQYLFPGGHLSKVGIGIL